jgi:putative transposase
MARPLRIVYPDAWYHIMNRGRRGEPIFIGKKDYQVFIELLKESSETWNIRMAAYCLMPNHYHLLVQTPEGNVSRAMRHINGVYTQRFNRFHGCDGQLFRGRYKSILLDADEYLLQLVRYIHRNPVRAGISKRIEGYPWTTHQGYLTGGKKWAWLYRDKVFGMLTDKAKERLKRYREFMYEGDDDEVTQFLESRKWPTIVGSEGFVEKIKGRFFDDKEQEEIPEWRGLAPGGERIRGIVCEFYGIGEGDLLVSRRGVFNEPRNMAIYLTRRLGRATLKETSKAFQIQKCSTVSSVSERMKALMATDQAMRGRAEALVSILIKSQEQT